MMNFKLFSLVMMAWFSSALYASTDHSTAAKEQNRPKRLRFVPIPTMVPTPNNGPEHERSSTPAFNKKKN